MRLAVPGYIQKREPALVQYEHLRRTRQNAEVSRALATKQMKLEEFGRKRREEGTTKLSSSHWIGLSFSKTE